MSKITITVISPEGRSELTADAPVFTGDIISIKGGKNTERRLRKESKKAKDKVALFALALNFRASLDQCFWDDAGIYDAEDEVVHARGNFEQGRAKLQDGRGYFWVIDWKAA